MSGAAQAKKDDSAARLIKAVQTCRRKVAGLADDSPWRDFLEQQTGKRSLREMTIRELGEVLDALHRNGAPKRPPRRKAGTPIETKAKALWLSLYAIGADGVDGTETGLRGFCERQVKVAAPRFVTPEEGYKLIEALKARLQRCGVVVPNPRAVKEWATLRALRGLQTPPGHLDKVYLVLALQDRAHPAPGHLKSRRDLLLYTAGELDMTIESLGKRVRALKAEAGDG